MRYTYSEFETIRPMSPKPPQFHYRDTNLKPLRELSTRPAGKAARKNVDTYLTELANRRRARGLTQSSVASAAGVRQSHISRIENLESRGVAFDTVLRYANALGLEFRLVEIGSEDSQRNEKAE